LVETARSRLADHPETPENLRDLSVQQLGDWQGAREAFTEGLEIARHLAKILPRHQDYKDLPDWFERRLGRRLRKKRTGIDFQGIDLFVRRVVLETADRCRREQRVTRHGSA